MRGLSKHGRWLLATLALWVAGVWLATEASTFAEGVAPHVAGVVALLRQLEPALSLSDIRQLLMQTGKPVLDQRNGLSFPRVDALAAVAAVLQRLPDATLAHLVNALDADGDLKVGDEEIMVAVERWITGHPLPGTALTVSDDAILALMTLWIMAQPASLSAGPDVW